MATLQMVVGAAGSGKTTWLCQRVTERSKKEPGRSFLFLVPEQFTMQTQKMLVDLSEKKVIANIDVLSFERLAWRVFDELGISGTEVLGENGKNLILRRVAQKTKLSVLTEGLNRMGFISELKSFVSECQQYQITPEALFDLAGKAKGDYFSGKLKDLAAIYAGFIEEIKGRFITQEEVLSLLIRVAGESELIRGSDLFLDGFTGFTPIQVKLLYALFPLVSEVHVSVCADDPACVMKTPELTELFYMSQKMGGQLVRIAADTGSEVQPPVALEESGKRRFRNAPVLSHLEKNLFRERSEPFAGEPKGLMLYQARNPFCEMENAAREIRRLVQEEGFRYREIAVVTADLSTYALYAEEAFGKYQIPYFTDQNKTVTYHPLTETIRGALYAVRDSFSYESVFHYLRGGLTDFSREEIDALETFVLAKGIRGSRWKQEFCGEGEETEGLNAMRFTILENLEPLRQVFGKKNRRIENIAREVYEFLLRHKAFEKMQALSKRQEELGEFAKAAETSKIYKIIIEFLDKASTMLEGEGATVEEFLELFDAALDSEKVGILPTGYDRVMLGDMERSRFQEIRALFFLGVNDGLVPKTGETNALLSEQEREVFGENDMELAPGEKERVFIQRFYLYMNLTRPSEKLFLSWSVNDREGKSVRPSYLIPVMKKLFPKLREKKEELPRFDREYHKELPKEPAVLPPSLCSRLYGNELIAGVTRLECFAECEYRHFLHYVLRLTERDLHEFQAPDLGTLIHDSLAGYGEALKKEGLLWTSTDPESRMRIINSSFDKAKENYLYAGFFEDAAGKYELTHLKRLFSETVEVLSTQLQAGSYEPKMFELPFRQRLGLGGERELILTGRIDRIDLAEDGDRLYARILDYKTGSALLSPENVYHGLSLQLPLYGAEAMEVLGGAEGFTERHLGGLLYYHVDDPLVDKLAAGEEAEKRERLRQLRPQGLMSAEEEALSKADLQFVGGGAGVDSDVIRVRKKKDGDFYADAKVLPEEKLSVLTAYAKEKARALGGEIMAGKAGVNPVQSEKKDACEYCAYKSVCGMESRLWAGRYRKLEELPPEEAIRRMEEELKK